VIKMNMRIFKNFKKHSQDRPKESMYDISGVVNPAIENVCLNIFSDYRDILMNEDHEFVVHAVWGKGKEKELSDIQKSIHERALPVISSALRELKVEELGVSQRYAIGYILRGLIITKILFMVEMLKNKIRSGLPGNKDDQLYKLATLKPHGNA
jgi:hypothetical protein